jgi:hypothetical protein
MVRAFRAFLDFCYTARRAFLTESHIQELKDALARFHQYRRVFTNREDDDGNWITAPRQHSMVHYPDITELFGAPNGLCTSITESKHIVAVKKPYRRSSHHDALSQIILVNQRLDKLAALRHALTEHGLLRGNILETIDELNLEEERQAKSIVDNQDREDSDEEDEEDDSEPDTQDEEDFQEDPDEEDGAVDDTRTSSHVYMARKHREAYPFFDDQRFL